MAMGSVSRTDLKLKMVRTSKVTSHMVKRMDLVLAMSIRWHIMVILEMIAIIAVENSKAMAKLASNMD
jgi:hypothetical protein